MRNIAIFASGTGTNARKIIEFFRNDDTVRIALVVSNKKDAGVLDIAREHGITALTVDRTTFFQSEALLERLHTQKIDFIVLAGFLWLIPPYLVNAFPRRMINIHPALLPAYGGKGMYGMHVHEAVKAAGDAETGITIHYVNEHYDEGDFVFQTKCPVHPDDTPADIARSVQRLEHLYFPQIIAKLVSELPTGPAI